MTFKAIRAWLAVALVVGVIVFGLLVAYGLISPEDSQEGLGAISTVVAGVETVVPLVETADATE